MKRSSRLLEKNDTIVAPVTASGSGAIGIVRLSGKRAVAIADGVFRGVRKSSSLGSGGGNGRSGVRVTLSKSEPYIMRYGTVNTPDGELLDEVMAVVFRAPHSYTGEDCVELYCHASPYIMEKLLQLLIERGARLAAPGEFTQRAFLNGKMDLSEAEAVADLIASTTRASHDVALSQMRGGFSKELKLLREKLLSLASLVELELDFSEEDVEFADRKKLEDLLKAILLKVSSLADSFELGNAIKNGIPVAIVGAVNTGKSSLLNALLGEERAIVSPIQGTTRDTIEDTLNIGGGLYRFIDTAGLRKTSETIERLGIERTYQKLAEASVIILMLDSSQLSSSQSGSSQGFRESISAIVSKIDLSRQKLIVVANKTDLCRASATASNTTASTAIASTAKAAISTSLTASITSAVKSCVSDIYKAQAEIENKRRGERQNNPANSGLNNVSIVCTSLILNPIEAAEKIKALLSDYAKRFLDDVGGKTLVTNARHLEALLAAKASLTEALTGLSECRPADLLASDIRLTINALSEILGEVSSQEILNNIFSKFCIGK